MKLIFLNKLKNIDYKKMIKFFGAMDIATALAVLLVHFGLFKTNLLYFFILYLTLKSFLFIKSSASWFDLLCVFYITLMTSGVKSFVVYIISFYLLQKGILSFV